MQNIGYVGSHFGEVSFWLAAVGPDRAPSLGTPKRRNPSLRAPSDGDPHLQGEQIRFNKVLIRFYKVLIRFNRVLIGFNRF